MKIQKAVITAAGRGVRMYPAADTVQKGMLPLVDRDGLSKPVIQIIAEEALSSGIEEVCIVCAPGDEDHYRRQLHSLRDNLLRTYEGVDWALLQAERLDALVGRLTFSVQHEPLGYGHAVYCARDFAGSESFLLLLSDHLYVSHDPQRSCAQQLLDLAQREECAVSAVHATREHLVNRYGTLTGKQVRGSKGLYQVERIIEKPSLSRAELDLQTPGMRAGYYLCFFGMHVLTPDVFEILKEEMGRTERQESAYQLTPSLQLLAERQKYLALDVQGARYDIGAKLGLLRAQIALSLSGADRNEVLTTLVELLAEDGQSYGSGPHA